jgi:hypothetical protein
MVRFAGVQIVAIYRQVTSQYEALNMLPAVFVLQNGDGVRYKKTG